MGLANATDGLRIGDIPELVLDGKNVTFSQVPAMIIVRHNLSKTRNKYVTFLAEEGCEHMLGYLRYRITQGDILDSESPLIAIHKKNRSKGWRNKDPNDPPFLSTSGITGSIRGIIRSVIEMRPYALRAYFDTQLLLAESYGCMTHAYRQFFMGHKGDMEARYTTNKGRLTEQMREDMRRAYRQSQIFLTSEKDSYDTEGKKRMLLDMWRQQAKMYGMNPDDMIRDGPGPEPAPVLATGAMPDGHALESDTADKRQGTPAPEITGTAQVQDHDSPFDSQIIDGESDLVRYCSQGWDLVRDIPGGRFLIRRSKVLSGRLCQGVTRVCCTTRWQPRYLTPANRKSQGSRMHIITIDTD